MDQFNRFPGSHEPEEEAWYHKAKDKAEEFISKIDPNLIVTVQVRKIMEEGVSDKHQPVLFFYNSTNGIEWSMDVEWSEEYLENEFEVEVRRIYNEEISKL